VSEKEKYRKIIQLAWYVNRFNHKELAHKLLERSYLKGRRLLGEDFNLSFINQGLKWANRDLAIKEQTQRHIFRPKMTNRHGRYRWYFQPSIDYNEGEFTLDYEIWEQQQ
jgi:hypothetical protein